jgi:hypothetical protein
MARLNPANEGGAEGLMIEKGSKRNTSAEIPELLQSFRYTARL